MPPAETREFEREYVAHRGALMAMLRSEWRSLQPEHEELYQEAWTELLELRARGEEIENVRALLKTIARRRARDRVRNFSAEPVDPGGLVLTSERDARPTPDEQAEIHLDALIVKEIIDTLTPKHAAILKLRYEAHLTNAEIEAQLGLSPDYHELLTTEAYKLVRAQLEQIGGQASPWTRRQRSLLLACEMGVATAAQRARVEEWLQQDPRCRALMREMRATLERVAAVLPPMPVLVERRDRFGAPVLDRFSELLAWGREQAVAIANRLSGQGTTLEQAGAGGAAGLGGATAAKVVAACLAAAGSAAVCVESGLLGGDAKPPPAKAAAQRPPDTRPVVFKADPPVAKAATRRRKRATKSAATTTPTSHEKAPASPARQGATEFSFEQTAPAAPPQPAAAPATGGDEFTP